MKKNKILLLITFFLIIFFGGITLRVFAAPLNFATAESIKTSSPSATLTIATGSVADALQVTATSVVITISNTTGGNLIILSPSYDLSVATSSNGGMASISCNNGMETAIFSQSTGSTVYTLTPTTQNCATASAPIIAIAPSSTAISATSATIGWTTNIPADSTILYGTTVLYGATSTNSTLVTTHDIILSGLSTSTSYHYKVISAENGTSTMSSDAIFITTSGISTTTSSSTAATPIFSLSSGTYTSAQGVTISCSTPSNTIYYTIDGSIPTTSSLIYAGSITISSSETLNAICVAPGYNNSPVASVGVVIQIPMSSGGGSSGSGGGGGGGYYIPPSTTSNATTTTGISGTESSSLNMLLSLVTEVRLLSLQMFLNSNKGRNLTIGSTGNDVWAIQVYLITNNVLSSTGPAGGKLINPTSYFGSLTKNALAEYQAQANIFPASGFLGPKTYSYLESIFVK